MSARQALSSEWALPPSVSAEVGKRPLGVYVHIPWCAHRCGYCDFNTYVPGRVAGADPAETTDLLVAEMSGMAIATRALGVPVETVFIGGGTPTLLAPADLNRILATVGRVFDLSPTAEVSIESNPETVDAAALDQLRAGGFNRLSLGMQSAVAEVLARLDRRHSPGRVAAVVDWARQAGFANISVDLIYGAVGETPVDWLRSVHTAIDMGVDHVSAYALKIESGSRLAAARAAGEPVDPDPDSQADKYLAAEEILSRAGLEWYEISNWAKPGQECRHNLGYWRGHDWLGFGPGAHSHVAGVRWWDHKHPQRWARAVSAGLAPVAGGEVLTPEQRDLESLMLALRLAEGIAIKRRALTAELVAQGLAEIHPLPGSGEETPDRLVLTRRGRLLADLVTLRIAEAS